MPYSSSWISIPQWQRSSGAQCPWLTGRGNGVELHRQFACCGIWQARTCLASGVCTLLGVGCASWNTCMSGTSTTTCAAVAAVGPALLGDNPSAWYTSATCTFPMVCTLMRCCGTHPLNRPDERGWCGAPGVLAVWNLARRNGAAAGISCDTAPHSSDDADASPPGVQLVTDAALTALAYHPTHAVRLL